MAKILIISDLHLGPEKNDVPPYTHGDISEDIIDLVSEDRLDLLRDAIVQKYKGGRLDLLVFLGDCVRGYDNEDSKKAAIQRFTKFLVFLQQKGVFSKPDGLSERIIILPGNHDVVKTKVVEDGKEKEVGSLNQFKDAFSQYLTPFTEKGNSDSIKRFGAPVFIFDDLDLIISCFSTSSLDAGQMPGILPAEKKSFVHSNNALKEGEKSIKYRNFARILFSHSPLVTLESGTTMVPYNYTTGGYDLMQTAAYLGYNLFFHGHIHQYASHSITNLLEPDLLDAIQVSVPQCIYSGKPDDIGLDVVEVETINNENNGVNSDKPVPCSYKIRHFSVDTKRQMFKETKPLVSDRRLIITDMPGDRILVDTQIEEIIKEGIIIKNGDSSRIEAASYDCALGDEYKREKELGGYEWGELEKIPQNKDDIAEIELQPKQTVLIYTEERFELPLDMVFHASPISSWARKGLRVDISYFVDPGFRGQFCFPVTNMSNYPISISSQERIMSIELIKIAGSAQKGWVQRNPDSASIRKEKKE